jgi:hypothetical protein
VNENHATPRKSVGQLNLFVQVKEQADGRLVFEQGVVDQQQAVQQFHNRLASPEFVEQMTGIFFDAKRAALAVTQ